MSATAQQRRREGARLGGARSLAERRAEAAAGAAFARNWRANMRAWLDGTVRSGDPAIEHFVQLYGKESANG